MKNSTINNTELTVVYALDDNFSLLTSVSIESLLTNNVGEFEQISVHILDSGLSEYSKSNLTSIAKTHHKKEDTDIEIIFHKMDDISQLEGLPQTERYPVATYFRLLIPQILSEDIKTCLYLDGDTIICQSLKELMQQDISDYDIGGVLDIGMSLIDPDNRGRDGKYINAGVLLINLERWRENNMYEIALKYASDNKADLMWNDQDILNAIIPEKSILLLPPRYNNLNTSQYYPVKVCKSSAVFQIYSSAAIKRARRKPVIIHYGGSMFAIGDLVYVKNAKALFERYRKKGPYSNYHYSEILNSFKGLPLKRLFAKRLMACIPSPLRGAARNFYINTKQLIRCKNQHTK